MSTTSRSADARREIRRQRFAVAPDNAANVAHGSDPADEQKNEDDHENDPIPPVGA